MGASREDVIVEANQQEGEAYEANFNRNNPDAKPLEGGLEADPINGYCFSKFNNQKCALKSKFKTTFAITPQAIENALDAYKVVYIMKVE